MYGYVYKPSPVAGYEREHGLVGAPFEGGEKYLDHKHLLGQHCHTVGPTQESTVWHYLQHKKVEMTATPQLIRIAIGSFLLAHARSKVNLN